MSYQASMIVSGRGRQRGQRKGYLYQRGPSWLLRWREYSCDATGNEKPRLIARVISPLRDPVTGRTVTRKEAERIAWEMVLCRLDDLTLNGQRSMTVGEFVSRHFLPEWVWALKPASKKHCQSMLKHICPPVWKPHTWTHAGRVVDGENGRYYIAMRPGRTGDERPAWPADSRSVEDGAVEWSQTSGPFLTRVRMLDASTSHVQAVVKRLIERGASTQTATHVRSVCSAIFRHAKATGHYRGDNPAAAVRLPAMVRKETHALTPDQARLILGQLPEPARTMSLVSALCSLNVAELCGLRRRHVNLTDEAQITRGEALPPRSLVVREHFYRGSFGSLKAGARRRTVPLPAVVVEALAATLAAGAHQAEDDPVFQNSAGGPVSELNLRKRVLEPAGRAIGLPFRLTWHVLRHTTATLAEAVGMPLSDRQALMGHASSAMTMHYTHSDVERRRAGQDRMAALVFGAAPNCPATIN